MSLSFFYTFLKMMQYCYLTKLGSTLLPHSKATLLTLGCGEGKHSVYCRAPSKENRQLVLKRPKLPSGFQGRFFLKAIFGVRVAACGLSSDWLVVRLQGDVSRILIINLLVPTSLGSSACGQHVVTILHLGRSLNLCRTTQRYVSDCCVYPLRRN